MPGVVAGLGVEDPVACVVGHEDVATQPAREHVGVRRVAVREEVVAPAGAEVVVGVDQVVAVVAVQGVEARAAHDPVIARPACDQVVAVTGDHRRLGPGVGVVVEEELAAQDEHPRVAAELVVERERRQCLSRAVQAEVEKVAVVVGPREVGADDRHQAAPLPVSGVPLEPRLGAREGVVAAAALDERFEEALASLDRALAYAPDNIEAQLNRGFALTGLRRESEALAIFDRLLATQADRVDARHGRALALHRAKRYDEALAEYDSVLALAPDLVPTLNGRAGVLREKGQFVEALAPCGSA